MKAVAPRSVDEYMSALPADVQQVLEKIRSTIKTAAPKAEEVISYQMPGYKYHGMLVYFAAFKDHCSLFPASKKVLEVFREELKTYKTFGGTIQFTKDHPLPVKLVKQIVQYRIKENEEKKALKDATKKALR
jgi:uncharacterized protein YdhG (YjbR/CyaY superfamily)